MIHPTMTAALKTLKERLRAAKEDPEALVGLRTGLHCLDQQVGGLYPGELVILAARPGQGKTALAWQMAINVATYAREYGLPGSVLFVCGEMPAHELLHREIARRTGVSIIRQRRGDYDAHEDLDIADAIADLSDLPIHFDTGAGISLDRVEHELETGSNTGGILLCVIDYLQMIRGQNAFEKQYQIITNAIHRIRELRDKINAPIVVLSQLRRGDGEEPTLEHLRDSGAIEEAANQVWLLHNPTDQPEAGTRLIVAKNRNGWTGGLSLTFHPEQVTFSDPMAPRDFSPSASQQEPQPCSDPIPLFSSYETNQGVLP